VTDVDEGQIPVAEDGVRRGLLTHAIYEILQQSSVPMHSSEVLARVNELVAFNDHELSKNASDQMRWRTAATRALSWSTFAGWLERDAAGYYQLTEGGAEALADLSTEELNLEVSRRYRASKRQRDVQGWQSFLAWARELVEQIDLDAEERDYKLKAAEKWFVAGQACASGSSDWAERLRQALGSGNLVDSRAQIWMRNRIDDEPDGVRTAFAELWEDGTIDAVDAFGEQVGGWGEYVSPGDRTVFASCLLLGRDPSSFAPYRPTLAQAWAERVGEEPGSTPKERLTVLLSLCDGLLERWGSEEPALRDRLDAQGLGWAVLKWAPPDVWSPLKQAELEHWRTGSAGDVHVARGEGVCPTMETAAWSVLSAGLSGESSVVVPGVRSWTVSAAADLAARLTTGSTGLGFAARLTQQLEGAPDEVRCLAAELLYLRDAPLNDVRAKTKADRINAILAEMSAAPVLPEELQAALDDGHSFSGGQGFHTRAPEHLQWLCRFVLHWLEQPSDIVDEALRDPFAFRDVTASVPDDSASIRYVIEYLAWPGLYPSVVSKAHRRKIRDGLIADIGTPRGDSDADVTRDLVALRINHHRKNKNFRSWYDPPYVNRWRPGSHTGPRAWLVRADDPEDVAAWLADGVVSLRDESGLALQAGMTASEVASLVSDGYAHFPPSEREELSTAIFSFLDAMAEDDLVVALADEHLLVGVIYDEDLGTDQSQILRRPVLWAAARTPLVDLSAKLSAALEQEGHVVDLTAVLELLRALPGPDDQAVPESLTPELSARAMLPTVPEDLADELFMSVEPLQEMIDLLNRRRQLVVYGPPGTGKTFVAKKLAERLAGSQDPSRVRLVQFHPSYAYEDFFEGFRPIESNGVAHFALQSGPLKLMAAEAAKAENQDKPYVLIIDELNRANLAKVFGELYFLLEYREETVRLQYRPTEPFSLPDNLFIIGTMNTADRSIALVDAAIRRRFPFYEMHPQREPVRGVLAKYASRKAVTDDRVALLEELNAAMGQRGHDLHIGPSYLMRDWLGEPGALDLVWRYDILPLLHEHFYGIKPPEMIDQEFGLESLRKRIESRSSVASGLGDGSDSLEGLASAEAPEG